MADTTIDMYAELTGGTPTPGPPPWPAAVARIAGIVPAAIAGKTEYTGILPVLNPEGLTALALGTYIIAAEEALPPDQVAVSQVWDALRDPAADPSRGVSQDYAVRSWSARLAALGHDLDTGIRWPVLREGPNGPYTLTCAEDVRLAYGLGPEGAATRLADPVAAAWLMLRLDLTPPGDTGMDDTSFIRIGSMLRNAVGSTLTALHREGAVMDWQPPLRPVF